MHQLRASLYTLLLMHLSAGWIHCDSPSGRNFILRFAPVKVVGMKMPVLVLGHGSPMNAVEENDFTNSLRQLSLSLPKPQAICVISAHWVTMNTHVLTEPRPRTIHDFYGFPKSLYRLEYPAPGAAAAAQRLAFEHHLQMNRQRGFVWSVSRYLYPDADVPVFQISLDHGRTFAEHVALGSELQKLRERDVLIIGSGNLVHNLHRINWHMPRSAYAWCQEFDSVVNQAISGHDAQALAAPEERGPTLFAHAHPTREHYVPICIARVVRTKPMTSRIPMKGFNSGASRCARYATGTGHPTEPFRAPPQPPERKSFGRARFGASDNMYNPVSENLYDPRIPHSVGCGGSGRHCLSGGRSGYLRQEAAASGAILYEIGR